MESKNYIAPSFYTKDVNLRKTLCAASFEGYSPTYSATVGTESLGEKDASSWLKY